MLWWVFTRMVWIRTIVVVIIIISSISALATSSVSVGVGIFCGVSVGIGVIIFGVVGGRVVGGGIIIIIGNIGIVVIIIVVIIITIVRVGWAHCRWMNIIGSGTSLGIVIGSGLVIHGQNWAPGNGLLSSCIWWIIPV